MKAIIQRVKHASVTAHGTQISQIGPGILTLLGVAKGDTEEQLEKTINKILKLRIFPDENGKMNKSLSDIQGEHLIVSQFTLMGNCQKGNRPGFDQSELPEKANQLYEKAIELSNSLGVKTLGGSFGAMMDVELLNDGPVTFILEF